MMQQEHAERSMKQAMLENAHHAIYSTTLLYSVEEKTLLISKCYLIKGGTVSNV